MDFKEIKKLSPADLKHKLTELQQKVRELRFSIANNQLKNVREIRQTKMTIARVQTALNQQPVPSEAKVSKSEDHKE